MIGNVRNLQTANDLGMLGDLFKPVVAVGIQNALVEAGGAIRAPDVTEAAAQVKEMLEADASPLLGAGAYAAPLEVAKHGLEVEPYWDMLPHLPINTFKPKKPHVATIVSAKRIVGASAPGEVCHIRIETGGAVKYWEGQSLGVKPPGEDPKTGKPNAVRLYSIASSRYGDDGAATSVSLCVRRAVYWDKELGREDPAKKGVCSNFLCDSQPGDAVSVTGPMGKVMLMPEHDPTADLIMVGTGTGIAPYRGFLRRLFAEDTPAKAAFKGLAWLFLGVPVTQGLLCAPRALPPASSPLRPTQPEPRAPLSPHASRPAAARVPVDVTPRPPRSAAQTTTSGPRSRRATPSASARRTRSAASSRRRTAARCTCRTAWRSTRRRSSSGSTTARTCTSAGSRG